MKDSNDLVSVVIPVYNSEKFLKESIESILNQTYENIQIIAVEDGSTDNSGKILEQYHDRICIISQSNQGLASAINSGIKKTEGKWFKWFSPDDILNPNAIQILVEEAKNLPESTIVYSNWEIIDENGKKLHDFSEPNFNNLDTFDFNVRLLDGQLINVNTTLIPSILFEKGGKIQNLKDPVLIDYDFFLNAGVLHNTHFHLIERSLLKYRIHKKQLSHKNIASTLAYLPQIRNNVLKKLTKSKQEKYLQELKEYSKKKPLSTKTKEYGLKIGIKIMPNWMTDRILIFYLNKIRRTR